MHIIDFRFLRTSDSAEIKYQAWSRIYEYPTILKEIAKSFSDKQPTIHNSSCGFEGAHITFRDDLDKIGVCTHSDIVKSEYRENYYYDITGPKAEFREKFDVVINISTIEHIEPRENQLNAIRNLFDQVKPGGLFLLSFDYPRVRLRMIEKLFGRRCDRKTADRLRGFNSLQPAKRWRHRRLSVVYLAVRKQGSETL